MLYLPRLKSFLRGLITPVRKIFSVRWLSLLLLSLFCTISLPGCLQTRESPLRVGVIIWPGYASFYLAENLGYYDSKDVQLTTYSSNSAMFKAFRSGELDAVALTMNDAMPIAETMPDIRFTMVIDSSHGADAILGKSDIDDLRKLSGKRVGVESSGLGAFFLTRALETVNLSTKDLQIVPLATFEHEKSFDKDKVDGLVTFEPMSSRLVAEGANHLFDSSQIPGEIVDVLGVHESTLKSKQRNLKHLTEGWFDAQKYLEENPKESAEILSPQYDMPAQDFLTSLKGVRVPTLEENQKLLGGEDSQLVTSSEHLVDIMLESGLLRKRVEPGALMDSQVVKSLR